MYSASVFRLVAEGVETGEAVAGFKPANVVSHRCVDGGRGDVRIIQGGRVDVNLTGPVGSGIGEGVPTGRTEAAFDAGRRAIEGSFASGFNVLIRGYTHKS